MSTNGHIPLSSDEITIILNEWSDAVKGVREALHENILQDAKSFQECEFDILVTYIIPASFPVCSGSAPNEITEGDDRFWDYPEFARIINERARQHKTTTKRVIDFALRPTARNFPDKDPLEILKEILLGRDGRIAILKRLLGEDEVRRIENEETFKGGIQRVSRRRRPDSSEDPEELKTIPEFTSIRAR